MPPRRTPKQPRAKAIAKGAPYKTGAAQYRHRPATSKGKPMGQFPHWRQRSLPSMSNHDCCFPVRLMGGDRTSSVPRADDPPPPQPDGSDRRL